MDMNENTKKIMCPNLGKAVEISAIREAVGWCSAFTSTDELVSEERWNPIGQDEAVEGDKIVPHAGKEDQAHFVPAPCEEVAPRSDVDKNVLWLIFELLLVILCVLSDCSLILQHLFVQVRSEPVLVKLHACTIGCSDDDWENFLSWPFLLFTIICSLESDFTIGEDRSKLLTLHHEEEGIIEFRDNNDC